ENLRKYAAELVTLGPDVMVATGGASFGSLFQATRTIPIVFANVPDPVGSGFVESLSRPGGNATGFLQFEYSLSGKWPELLKQIVALAARHKLPAVYFQQVFVTEGGLISYGADFFDQYRRAAGYVDRILKGEKPANLPVQAPTKYELVINLKTAKAQGLTIPP